MRHHSAVWREGNSLTWIVKLVAERQAVACYHLGVSHQLQLQPLAALQSLPDPSAVCDNLISHVPS